VPGYQKVTVLLGAAATTQSSFNSNFYTTVATVIPVLILGLSFATFRRFGIVGLFTWIKADPERRRVWGRLSAVLIITPATLALVSEAAALTALLHRTNAGSGFDGLMLAEILLLAALVVAGILDTIRAEADRLSAPESSTPSVPQTEVQTPGATRDDGDGTEPG
jgi:hypothetical protein